MFVFLAPGRTGLILTSETGVAREGDVAKAFPIGADVEVAVLEVDPAGRRIRPSVKAIGDAREAEEVASMRGTRRRGAGGGIWIASPTSPRALKPREK